MNIQQVEEKLINQPSTWLVTGAAGFIGSNLCHRLLQLGQKVKAVDNFSTGLKKNIEELQAIKEGEFQFVEGDLTSLELCSEVCKGVDFILHQAALGSVPRSIKAPIPSHQANVNAFINMIWSAHENKVKKMVYASSSSVYGDHPALPKVEENIGKPLSPYAATKFVDEVYAEVFYKTYELPIIGLRYFNVFGPRQRPDGPYAAVIPKWLGQMFKGEQVEIFGDGESSRDFCFVKNVIQMNILAALNENEESLGQVFNVAYGQQTNLKTLFELLREAVGSLDSSLEVPDVVFKDFRPGDVRHSLADTSKANRLLGYDPTHSIRDGLGETVPYFSEVLK